MEEKLLATGMMTSFLTPLAAGHSNGTNHMMNSMWHGGTWGGNLFMLALWALVILGIIYLSQKIVQNFEDDNK